MKILIFIILMDIFIFALGSIFIEDKHRDVNVDGYHMDRYGYCWQVDE